MLKKWFTNKQKRKLNEEINRTQLKLSNLDESSDEYQKTLSHLTKLFKLRDDLKIKVSPAVVTGVIGIIQILLILNYEKTDILTSKASHFVSRGRG
jgi:hypothetical protein